MHYNHDNAKHIQKCLIRVHKKQQQHISNEQAAETPAKKAQFIKSWMHRKGNIKMVEFLPEQVQV